MSFSVNPQHNRFSEDQARYYFRQLIEGMEYCHSQGVCHRDLKPENLLLDEEWNLKVCVDLPTYLPLGGIDHDLMRCMGCTGLCVYVCVQISDFGLSALYSGTEDTRSAVSLPLF